jgi:hypothetical protein
VGLLYTMNLEELSKQQLIDIIHQQADDIAAKEMELAFVKQGQQLKQLPEKEALRLQPVDVDGVQWYFACPRWIEKGKTVTAYDVMADEARIKKILSTPYQVILKKVNV